MSQAELAQKLGLSQSRLSELENGAGSFSAEQLVLLLQVFNVTVENFAHRRQRSHTDTLQNALARLGQFICKNAPTCCRVSSSPKSRMSSARFFSHQRNSGAPRCQQSSPCQSGASP